MAAGGGHCETAAAHRLCARWVGETNPGQPRGLCCTPYTPIGPSGCRYHPAFASCSSFRGCMPSPSTTPPTQTPHAPGCACRPVHTTLAGLSRDVSVLHDAYRAAARGVQAEASTAQRSIDGCRRQLTTAFEEHVAACYAFEAVLGCRGKGRPAKGPELDPWATEGRLVQVRRVCV